MQHLELILDAVSFYKDSLLSVVDTPSNRLRLLSGKETPNFNMSICKDKRDRTAGINILDDRIEFRYPGADSNISVFLTVLNYIIGAYIAEEFKYSRYEYQCLPYMFEKKMLEMPEILSTKEYQLWSRF
jgi:hypothetical protein